MREMEKSSLKPLLWQRPWWLHPSSRAPAAAGPGNALYPPPTPAPGG